MCSPNSDTCRDPWRHVVLVAYMAMNFLQMGFFKSLGVLVPALVIQFQTTYSTIGLLTALGMSLNYIACPFVAVFLNHFNPRLISIIGGVGAGFSLAAIAFVQTAVGLAILIALNGIFGSVVNLTCIIMLHHHHRDQFGFASSTAYIGTIIGAFVFPFITDSLFTAYGLQGTLFVLGTMMLNYIPIAATLRPPRPRLSPGENDRGELLPSNGTLHSDRNTSSTSPEDCSTDCFKVIARNLALEVLWQEPLFSIFMLPIQILVINAQSSWVLFVMSYGLKAGLIYSEAIFLPICGAVGGIVSRLALSLLLRWHPSWSHYIFTCCCALASFGFCLQTASSSLAHLLICSMVIGSNMYGAVAIIDAVIANSVTAEHFPSAITMSYFVAGIGYATSGSFSGFLFDVTGSFPLVFIFLGVIMGTGVLLMTIFIVLQKSNWNCFPQNRGGSNMSSITSSQISSSKY